MAEQGALDWTKVVYRIEGADDAHRGQGTGFAFGHDADGALLVVTCWHVVREIHRDKLRIKGRHCEVVSSDGDDDLDLAVLRVAGLACDAPLSLAPHGAPGQPFDTYGYEPIGRLLSGKLGAAISRPHVSRQDVPAWDYYLDDGVRELEKIKDGYSGAPVCDLATGGVIAVITHRQGTDKGFAIDIANLPRVYPQGASFIAASQAEADGEYASDSAIQTLPDQLSDGQKRQSAPRIFISYAQYEHAHSKRVLALAHALATDGLDVELDQFHGHEIVNWPRWCKERLKPENTDFVLMVCTAEYHRRIEGQVELDEGRGVFWEGNLIDGYLYRAKANERFVPLLLDDEPESSLPPAVANWNHFRLRDFGLQSADQDYKDLYRLLTNQPATLKPTSGELVWLPAESLPEASELRLPMPSARDVEDHGQAAIPKSQCTDSTIQVDVSRQKADATPHYRTPTEPKPGARVALGRRYFAAAALSTLLMAGLYPLALWYQFGTGTAWYYFKHNPNYSVFVLGIFPLAIGLFVRVATQLLRRRVPIFWKVLLFVGGLPILLTVVLHDALDKGPPIQPTHLAMTATQQQAILTMEKKIRSTYFEDRNRDSETMRHEYAQGVARILAVNESEISKFVDLRDFLRRASVVAYVDLFISLVSAAFVIVVLWTLAFVSSQRSAMKNRYGEAISWVYVLLILWLPLRIYALWHQNFYFLTSKGELFVFALLAASVGLLLLVYLWSTGTVERSVQFLIVLVSAGLGAFLFFEPNILLRMIGEGAEVMSWRLFISSEITLVLLLIAAIWPYLDGE